MKEGQEFKLIKWNKQLISVATGILLISQLTVGPIQVLAETTDSTSPNSSESIDPENQLDVSMTGELFATENQDSDGNTGAESQASATRGTTRNGASPQIGEVTTEQGLKDAIASASTTGAPAIVLSGTIDISSVIGISGKEITLTSTDGATLIRETDYLGGVFDVTSSGSLTLDGVSVDGNEDNKGTAGSSLISLIRATFTIKSGIIKNGNAQNGGAINAGNVCKVNITGGTIKDNTATSRGGGIYADRGANVTVSGNGTISDNKSNNNGGGIFVSDFNSQVNVNGGTISGNTGYNNGGGIYASSGTVTVRENGIISGNKTTNGYGVEGGGGIYAEGSSSKVNIEGGVIRKNKAAGYGGGISSSYGTVKVSGGIISDNTANGGGSSIFNYNSSETITMTGGLIYGVADAATDLVYSFGGGTLTGPTENGAIIAKSASSSSPYEWGSGTGIDAKFDNDFADSYARWGVKDDKVGILYSKRENNSQTE